MTDDKHTDTDRDGIEIDLTKEDPAWLSADASENTPLGDPLDMKQTLLSKTASVGFQNAVEYCEMEGWDFLATRIEEVRADFNTVVHHRADTPYACVRCEYTGPMTVPGQTMDDPMVTECPACGEAADHPLVEDDDGDDDDSVPLTWGGDRPPGEDDEPETGSTHDEHIELVECDGCGEEALPYDTERASQHTRGYQCRNCGRMY